MKISIIIPFYNHWKLCNDRLMELFRLLPNTPGKYEVVVYNDGSSKLESSDAQHGISFWSDNPKFSLLYVVGDENRGFGYAMNSGVEISSGDIICLLSNDVVVSIDFTEEVEKLLQENNRRLLGEVLSHDTGWNTIDKTIIPYVNGWFVACTREVFDELEGFDWLTYGIADYEDIDLSLKAYFAGVELKQLECMRFNGLRHMGAQTLNYGEERLKQTNANRKKFVAKWSGRLNEQKRKDS